MALPTWWLNATHPEAEAPASANLWHTLQTAVGAKPTAASVWQSLKAAMDVAQRRPQKAEGIVVRQLQDRLGPYYVLKNPQHRTYLRLSPREFWLWERLDGKQSVQDLVLAYFLAHGTFALSLVVSLTQQLLQKRMLHEEPQAIWSMVRQGLKQRSLGTRLTWPAQSLFTRRWTLGGLDATLTQLYRWGGWALFTWPAQIVYLILSLLGLLLFGQMLGDVRFILLGNSLGLGVISLWFAAILPILIHELGHALTVKHYGREVQRGGVMLYFGMPAAFVDTSDIWLEGKRARLAVTWAGPYTGFILGGVCALLLWLVPNVTLATFVFQMATISILNSLLNLNPLLKLDGYYLLSDALEIHNLRERSFHFIRRQLRAKLAKREKLTREEVFYLAFGLLSAIWTGYVVYLGFVFWNARVWTGLQEMFNRPVSGFMFLVNGVLVLLAASFLVLLGVQTYRLAKKGVKRLRRSRWITRPKSAVAVLAVGTAIVLLLAMVAGGAVLAAVLGLLACLATVYLAFTTAAILRGSRTIARAWLVLAVGLITLTLAQVVLALPSASAQRLAWALDWAALSLFGIASILGSRWFRRLTHCWRTLSMRLLMLATAVLMALAFLGEAIPQPLKSQLHLFVLLGYASGVAHWRLFRATPVTYHPTIALPLTLRERLWDAFEMMSESILRQLAEAYGQGNAERVAEKFNRLAAVRGWQAQFVDEAVPSNVQLGAQDWAEALAVALTTLLDLTAHKAGTLFARTALVRSYDALTWEQREIAVDHLLWHVPWAKGLAAPLTQTRPDLITLLERAPLFAAFTPAELQAVAGKLRVEHFAPGEDIVTQGEVGSRFYVLWHGRVAVVHRDLIGFEHQENELVSGDSFGEAALLNHEPRHSTIRALTPVTVVSLSKRSFDRLLRPGFEGQGKVAQAVQRVGLLRRNPLFKDFDHAELKRVVGQLKVVTLAAGETLFEQGAPGNQFYIIEAGELAVRLQLPNDQVLEKARCGPGEWVGEMALMLNCPRTATVVATTPAQLLALEGEAFAQLVRETRGFHQALARVSSGNLLTTSQLVQQALAAAGLDAEALNIDSLFSKKSKI